MIPQGIEPCRQGPGGFDLLESCGCRRLYPGQHLPGSLLERYRLLADAVLTLFVRSPKEWLQLELAPIARILLSARRILFEKPIL